MSIRTHGAGVPAALALAAACAAVAAGEAGRVDFSDGSGLAGTVRPAPGARFVLHGGEGRRLLSPERIAEIRLLPEREELRRRWRFVEPGRATREEHGEPRPIRDLAARVILVDGSRLAGRLQTTVLTVAAKADGEDEAGTERRVILRSQQKGAPGQTLADLVYPRRIVLRPVDRAEPLAPDRFPQHLRAVVWLETPALCRIPARRDEDCWVLPGGRGQGIAAWDDGDVLHVAWPGRNASHPRWAAVGAAVTEFADYFDERRLLGLSGVDGEDHLALVLAARRGVSTGPRPWRLLVLRLRFAAETDRVLLAARGHLFRGLLGATGDLPEVRLVAPPEADAGKDQETGP